LFQELRAEIEKLHSYEVPEVIVIPLVDGAERYLAWMDSELTREREP
jgi:periplasmic divalent cation tolerance protein